MGLSDILTGMMNGPRGDHATHDAPHSGGGGVSKLDWAMIALLAYRAYQGKGPMGGMFGGGAAAPGKAAPGIPGTTPASDTGGSGGLGGLGDIFKGGGSGGLLGSLGGLLAGGAAGGILSGGLGDLLKQFQQNGLGDTANSWVGSGENKPIAPDDLRNALGDDTIKTLAEKAGMPQDELLSGLSQRLPGFIDKLTPHGRLPAEHEV